MDEIHVGKLTLKLGQELVDSYDNKLFVTRVVMFVVAHDVEENTNHTFIASADPDGDEIAPWEMYGVAESIRIRGVEVSEID